MADRLVAADCVDAASELLEHFLVREPANPEVLRRLGRIRLAQGQPEIAAPLLKKAIEAYRARKALLPIPVRADVRRSQPA